MKIVINDIFEILEILKSNIKESIGKDIIIDDDDYYWKIKDDELFNPLNDPKEILLGQISYDWSDLLRLKEKGEIPISYDLVRLAAILQFIRKKSIGKW